MHVVEGEDDLGGVKLSPFLIETVRGTHMQMIEQLSSIDELHHHVQVHYVLKRILQLHNKWVVEHGQDIALGCKQDGGKVS